MDAPDVTSARQDLAEAQEKVRQAEVRQELSSRPGVVYAPLDEARTRYLVVEDGEVLGYLHHPHDASILEGWTAHPINDDRASLGPCLTARMAIGELLKNLKRP